MWVSHPNLYRIFLASLGFVDLMIGFSFSYLANGQFKLLGITYLVGKIKFKLLFQGPGRLSKF